MEQLANVTKLRIAEKHKKGKTVCMSLHLLSDIFKLYVIQVPRTNL